MQNIPIIFCHHGFSEYLPYTLECAQITNANKRLYFLGNREIKEKIKKYKWIFHEYSGYHSALSKRFEDVFVEISHPTHNNYRGSLNWLKFVFIRWFYVYDFCVKNEIQRFWHFDTDTMILMNLDIFENNRLLENRSTMQCHGNCLNGIIQVSDLHKFLISLIEQFSDPETVNNRKIEFASLTGQAFTEMRAFCFYKESSAPENFLHLERLIPGYWFDDLLCYYGNAEYERINIFSPHHKKVDYMDGKHFVYSNNLKIQLITANLSWLSLEYFSWFLNCVKFGKNQRLYELKLNPKTKMKLFIKWFINLFRRNWLKSHLKNMST